MKNEFGRNTWGRKGGDITLQIEASTDLFNWSNASDLLIGQSSTDLGDGTELTESTLSPTATDTLNFFRIRATLHLLQN